MSTKKLDIEKFDKNVKFGLQQVKMKAILIQSGVYKAIDGVMITHDFTKSSYDSCVYEKCDILVKRVFQIFY